MNEKKVYVRKRMGKLSDHIELNDDPWYTASKGKLKQSVLHKMKRIYVGALDIIDDEVTAGKITNEVARRLRSKILNIGNDQMRNISIEIDERYNVEALNYHVKLPVKPIEGLEVDYEG